jgi:hypothetical protein
MNVMSDIKNLLDALATGKRLVLLSSLSLLSSGLFLRFGFADLPTRTLLDTSFHFTPVQVHEVLGSYSPTMMNQYVRAEIIDLVMAPLTCTTEALLLVSGFREWPWAQWACVLPIGVLASNTIKDLLMLGIIKAYPTVPVTVVQVTSLMNLIKTVLVGLSLSLVLVALGNIVVRFLSRGIWRKAST